MNEIERGKIELETIVRRLKVSLHNNPSRALFAQSLEAIVGQVASVSGQLNLWFNKREEKKRYYANKLSYEDVMNKKITKYYRCALFKKS